MRLTDQQADLERLKRDLASFRQQKEEADEEISRLQAKCEDLERSLEESTKERAYKDEVIADKESELKKLDEKVASLEESLTAKEDETMSLRIEANRLKESEKKQVAAIKSLHSDIARQSSLIAHLKRLQTTQSESNGEALPSVQEADESAVTSSLYPDGPLQEINVSQQEIHNPLASSADEDNSLHDLLR